MLEPALLLSYEVYSEERLEEFRKAAEAAPEEIAAFMGVGPGVRVFLDANVLFSTALGGAGFQRHSGGGKKRPLSLAYQGLLLL